MAKTFEALARSQQDSREGPGKTSGIPKAETWSTKIPILDFDALRPYQNLRTNLMTRYKDESIKTILFTGTAHGDGASTTAINFAAMLTRKYRMKVLFGDLTGRTNDQFEVLEPDSASSTINNPADSIIELKKIGPEDFYLPANVGSDFKLVNLLDSGGFDKFFKTACEDYSYIILVAPPVLSSLEARVICANVDGVVLVLASGKTRRQTARKAKETLQEAGGRVLGAVLNRRKLYIPEWVYRRL